jgi:CobQ-like glutamine amidotransferase family enzyme
VAEKIREYARVRGKGEFMSERVLNIMWLLPDILNLHGDRGNLLAVERACENFGIKTDVRRVTRLSEEPDFASADLLLLGPGELAVMPGIIKALSEKREALEAYAAAGKVIFCVGTTGASLARETVRTDGSVIKGLGILDMECREREAVFGDDIIFSPAPEFGGGEDSDVLGIQIQMMDTVLGAGQKPFGSVIYGRGNNGGGTEGAVSGGIIFTNALGPVLVKNPWLTLRLVQRALEPKCPGIILAPDENLWTLERKSAAAIREFNMAKIAP